MSSMNSQAFLLQPLSQLKGIGIKQQQAFAKLKIANLEQLLLHLPLRYEDHSKRHFLAQIAHEQSALLHLQIIDAKILPGKRARLVARATDGSTEVQLTWFYFQAYQLQRLRPGSCWRVYAQIRHNGFGLEIVHPQLQPLASLDQQVVNQGFLPVYSLVDKLSQSLLRSAVAQALQILRQMPSFNDLPVEWQQRFAWPSLFQALNQLHFPQSNQQVEEIEQGTSLAMQRLLITELLAHHLSLKQVKQQQAKWQAYRPQPGVGEPLAARLRQSLPFSLTSAQERVIAEITEDLQAHQPMQRLLQGDVGSGKTLVACFSMLPVLASGWQVAILAPTEILAEQHFQNFSHWLEPMGISTALLTGKQKKSQKKQLLSALAEGKIKLVVGTHAIFQPDVEYTALALVILDEQHRFGVEQRLSLLQKGQDQQGRSPHQLAMSATPIPRTLAMTLWGDLACSVIDELPPGRQAIETRLISSERRYDVMERIAHAVKQGAQAYWVNTLIEESEQLNSQAAEETWQELSAGLPGLSIGLIHGRQKPKEKQDIMAQFKAGELQVLVATTVIEVGVDVPNASIMIIENAERLGLAQLHQLRGRVGRGSKASFCLLLYQGPMSEHGKARLQAMRESQDGFFLAEQDLQLRGPGELLGKRQSGAMQFRLVDLVRDVDLLPRIEPLAIELENSHPQLITPLIERWLAHCQHYAQA